MQRRESFVFLAVSLSAGILPNDDEAMRIAVKYLHTITQSGMHHIGMSV